MPEKTVSNKEKFEACIILHALGDTIGFKNAEWEFNHGLKVDHTEYSYTLELIFEFIKLGGSNDISFKGWHISDDTVLHMMTMQGLIEAGNKSAEELGETTAKLLTRALTEGMMDGRAPGYTTVASLRSLADGTTRWNNSEYATTKGGSGVSMRTSCIGLAFHHPEQVPKLVETAYLNGQITHNSAVGILGGITASYFTALAYNNVSINKWPFKLISLLRSKEIQKVVKKFRPETWNRFKTDQEVFINKWIRYVEMRFDDKGKPIDNPAMMNPAYRSSFYYRNFGYHETKYIFPGSGGDDSVIIAYDSLLDALNKWETLVVYSMLHLGDSDTVGCIAASWYGAMYGYGSVPQRHHQHLELKDTLVQMSHELYDKYGK